MKHFFKFHFLVAAKSAERSSRSKYHSNYPHRNESGPPPPYEVAQGMLHAGNGQMKIRDPALRAAVASCYIERNRIHLGRKIKEGNFGVVYDAKWNQSSERTRRVAAKTMKNIESQQQLENFLKEGVMMKGNGLHLSFFYSQNMGVCISRKLKRYIINSKRLFFSNNCLDILFAVA